MTQPCLTYSPARAGRAPRARDVELIERAAELDALRATVADAVAGRGALVVLEAPAGLGKTTLLDRAAELAAEAGCAVRSAAPGPREREFPYGVLRALLEAPVRDAGAPLVFACATHAVLSGPAIERLTKSNIDELIVTDTIPRRPDAAKLAKLHVLSVAPLLGEAIRRTHDEASITSLFI